MALCSSCHTSAAYGSGILLAVCQTVSTQVMIAEKQSYAEAGWNEVQKIVHRTLSPDERRKICEGANEEYSQEC